MDFPRISSVVMTHPKRMRYAQTIRDTCPELNFDIVSDPDPCGSPSARRTAALAWRIIDRTATHHLVVQDDIVLCDSFAVEIAACVQAMPEAALTFFAHWGSRLSSAARLAILCGLSWTEIIGDYVPTVAMILPADVARELAEALKTSGNRHDDVVARDYLRMAGVDARLSVPNLVEHLELPSLAVNDPLGIRHAACFVPRNPNPARWGREVLSPVALPYVHADTGQSTCYVRDRSAGMGGYYVPIDAALRERGAEVEEIYRALRIILERQEWIRKLSYRMDWSLLRGLWASAFLLGVLTVETRRVLYADSTGMPHDPGAFLAQPTVAAALSTMAPGMLRNLMPTADLTELRLELAYLVTRAVEFGLQSCPGSIPLRSQTPHEQRLRIDVNAFPCTLT